MFFFSYGFSMYVFLFFILRTSNAGDVVDSRLQNKLCRHAIVGWWASPGRCVRTAIWLYSSSALSHCQSNLAERSKKIQEKNHQPSPPYRFDMPSCKVVRYNSKCIRLKQKTSVTNNNKNTFCWITMWLAFWLTIKRWNWDKRVCERNTKQDILRESVIFHCKRETAFSVNNVTVSGFSTLRWPTSGIAIAVPRLINYSKRFVTR